MRLQPPDKQGGFTLIEVMIVMIIIGIIVAIALPSIFQIVSKFKLRAAIFELSQFWKETRLDATDSGNIPSTICMAESASNQVVYAQVQGKYCDSVTSWQYLPRGVSIDEENSTLRTVSGVAGNDGKIYRVSWADTNAGYGGSWGQLGRITLQAGTGRQCLVLFNIKGEWETRKGTKCVK
ncbi:MAG: prepilin-type N-terminal cleavage/methylation domain-containing protein [Spirulinaceae cyanobacterium]